MRKEFTMRCNEEQFQSVLPAIIQYGIDYSEVEFDNDKCFVMFNPFSNSIKSISSEVATNLIRDVIFFDSFRYNTFIGRISGLDWLEPKKQTLEDLKEKKPYPASMADMFQKDPKAELIVTDDQVDESRKIPEPKYDPKFFEGFAAKFFGASDPAIEGGDVTVSAVRIDLPKQTTEFHISFFPKKESPISSGINISAGNAALAYMEFKKTHPDIEPFCIHDKSQL